MLKDAELLPFFGSRLGIAREGDLLKKDDDVDFYVRSSDRDKVIKAIAVSGFTIDTTSSVNSDRPPSTGPIGVLVQDWFRR